MIKFSHSVYFKYIVSYSIAFVIPLLVLGAIMYVSFSQLLKDEISRNSVDMLSSAQSVIDSRIEELNNTAIQISSNPSFRPDELSQNFMNVVNAVNQLGNISLTNKFYSGIFIYYKENDLIYSSSGTYRIDQLFKYIYNFKGWDTESFINDMNSLKNITVKSEEIVASSGKYEQTSKYVIYIVPLPYGSKRPNGAVFFMIDENSFSSSLKNSVPFKKGNIMVLNAEKVPIISYGDGNFPGSGLLKPDIFEDRTDLYHQMILNNTYSVSYVESGLTGWTYAAVFPISEVYGKMAPLLTKVILGFILLISMGFVVIYFLAKMNYKPILDLMKFSEAVFSKASGENTEDNEIETVKMTVNRMTGVISTLRKKVETSIPSIRNSVLTRIIQGYYTDLDTLNEEASEAGISFNNDCFTVAVLIIHGGDSEMHSSVINLVEGYESDHIQPICIDGMDRNRIVVLLSVGQEYIRILHGYMSDLLSIIWNKQKLEITAGLGKPVSNIRALGNSYLEASAALDYRYVKGKHTVISFDEIANREREIHYYPKEKLDTLKVYVLKADPHGILAALADMFDEIKTIELPLFYVKLFSFNIINSIYDSIYRSKSGINLREYKYADITFLAKLETIDDLSMQIAKFCIFVCSIIKYQEQRTVKNKIEQMAEYIACNFSNPDFSLQKVADKFEMSLSGLSNYFKNNMGENISDYVNRMRLDYAKKLLIETDYNLQVIVNKIGYVNVSSFIRKFREHTQVTPGDFRHLMKAKN